MGIVLKIIGFFLLLGGLYGLFVTIPILLLNVTVDQFNPLVIFGFIQPQATGSIFDLILSLILIGVGIIFIKKNDRPKIVPR